jgi:hypothetical protein
MLDPDGVEPHGDEKSGIGETAGDAPNKANFGETLSIVETQGSIEVTANSGALPGLDNSVPALGARGSDR